MDLPSRHDQLVNVDSAVESSPAPDVSVRVWSFARYTFPIHAILPMLMWWAGRAHEGLLTVLFLIIHLGFPLVLVLTYPSWRGQGAQVTWLIACNHAITFAVGIGLALIVG